MREPAYRRKKHNVLGYLCITLVVVMLLAVIGVDGLRLKKKQAQYDARIAELEAQIEKENQRTEELKEFSKYTKTKKYAEEIAENRLGLVHDGEIIFKPEDD